MTLGLEITTVLALCCVLLVHASETCSGKGMHSSSCSAVPDHVEDGSDGIANASTFKPTATNLCPTNSQVPLRSFVPPDPKGPGENEGAMIYNENLRLEVLVWGDGGSDSAKRTERSWGVQGLNITRLSATQQYGSEALEQLLDHRRNNPSLVLMFIDQR